MLAGDTLVCIPPPSPASSFSQTCAKGSHFFPVMGLPEDKSCVSTVSPPSAVLGTRKRRCRLLSGMNTHYCSQYFHYHQRIILHVQL